MGGRELKKEGGRPGKPSSWGPGKRVLRKRGRVWGYQWGWRVGGPGG